MDDNEYPPGGDHRPHLSLERQLPVGPHVYQLTASSKGDERIGLALVGWNASGEVVSEISGGISPADLAAVADALTSTLAGLATLRRERLTAACPDAAPGPATAGRRPAAAVPGSAAAPESAAVGVPAGVGVPAAVAMSAGVGVPAAVAIPAGVGVPATAARRNARDRPAHAGAVPAGDAVPAPAGAPAKRHRHQGLRWSAEDDDRLAARHRAGATPKELMAEFGRSRGGIKARLEHLGLIIPDGVPAARPPSRAPERDPAHADQEGDPVAAGVGVIADAA